jgi:hypothetical protein
MEHTSSDNNNDSNNLYNDFNDDISHSTNSTEKQQLESTNKFGKTVKKPLESSEDDDT